MCCKMIFLWINGLNTTECYAGLCVCACVGVCVRACLFVPESHLHQFCLTNQLKNNVVALHARLTLPSPYIRRTCTLRLNTLGAAQYLYTLLHDISTEAATFLSISHLSCFISFPPSTVAGSYLADAWMSHAILSLQFSLKH